MEDGGVAGVVIQLTVRVTGETVGSPRAPAVSTGGVTRPALIELRTLLSVVTGGTAEAAVAGHQVGLAMAGQAVVSPRAPTLVTAVTAPHTLPGGRVQPVARAALVHTHSSLATSNISYSLQYTLQSVSYLQKVSRLTGEAVAAVTGLAGVGATDTGVSLARCEGS